MDADLRVFLIQLRQIVDGLLGAEILPPPSSDPAVEERSAARSHSCDRDNLWQDLGTFGAGENTRRCMVCGALRKVPWPTTG